MGKSFSTNSAFMRGNCERKGKRSNFRQQNLKFHEFIRKKLIAVGEEIFFVIFCYQKLASSWKGKALRNLFWLFLVCTSSSPQMNVVASSSPKIPARPDNLAGKQDFLTPNQLLLLELGVSEDDAEGNHHAASHGHQAVGTIFPLGQGQKVRGSHIHKRPR